MSLHATVRPKRAVLILTCPEFPLSECGRSAEGQRTGDRTEGQGIASDKDEASVGDRQPPARCRRRNRAGIPTPKMGE